MRYDDPNVFWDAEDFFYDMPEEDQPQKKTPMAKPKLTLRALTPLQKAQKAYDIQAAMAGNPKFAMASNLLTELNTKADLVSAKFSEREAASTTLDLKQEELDLADKALDVTLTSLMSIVEGASGGVAADIISAGFEVRGVAAPIGSLPQVTGLDSRPGESEGSIILRWVSVKGSKSYEIQTCPDPITATGWRPAGDGSSTKATLLLEGLPTGGRCWFRVRAIGAAGPGPWSDPCVKTVP